jgi:hypothetical protein
VSWWEWPRRGALRWWEWLGVGDPGGHCLGQEHEQFPHSIRGEGQVEIKRQAGWVDGLIIFWLLFPVKRRWEGGWGEGAVVLRERGRTTVSSNRGGWGNVRRQQCQDSLKMDAQSHWWGQFVQVGTFSSTWRCTGTGEAWQRAWGFAWLTWP